jgi:hypothetical protein
MATGKIDKQAVTNEQCPGINILVPDVCPLELMPCYALPQRITYPAPRA